jgi:hypothetical protein
LYKKIHLETFENYLTTAQEDSVLKTTPKAFISVTNQSGEKVSITVYDKGFVDPFNRDEEYDNLDPERFYLLTEDNQLVISQRIQWDPLLVPLIAFNPQ